MGDKNLWGGTTHFAVEDGGWFKERDAFQMTRRIFRSIPWTSYVHMRQSARWEDLPWRQVHARRVLVAAAFNPPNQDHKQGLPKESRNLRRLLNRTCASWPSECTFAGARMPSKDSAAEPVRELAHLYSQSTFCLQPMGDSVTRKAILDALLLGCINVLFHPLQLRHWPWHWGGWIMRATVFLDYKAVLKGQIDPIATLKATRPADIRQMQRTLAEHAHCMHYADLAEPESNVSDVAAVLGSAPDAFDILLRGAWELAQNASLAWQRHGVGRLPGQRRSAKELCEPVPWTTK